MSRFQSSCRVIGLTRGVRRNFLKGCVKMTCEFHGTVAVKIIFLVIIILSSISEDLFIIIAGVMIKNNVQRFSEEACA